MSTLLRTITLAALALLPTLLARLSIQ